MKKTVYFLVAAIASATLLVACAPKPKKTVAAPPEKLVSHKRVKLPAFNRVNFNGYFNVALKGGASSSRSAMRAIDYPSEPVTARVTRGTLFLTAPSHPLPGLSKRPTVTLYAGPLKKLVVRGSVNVSGVNVNSRGLVIRSQGSGTIKLKGTAIKLNRIHQTGSGRIDVQWVNSGTLYISGRGAGHIRLAGVAKVVYARLGDRARLRAQYLRTGYVQVQTENNSAAYVLAVNTLRAFAMDHANIYYFKV